MADVRETVVSVLTRRLAELRSQKEEAPKFQEHIWVKEIVDKNGATHTLEFYLAQRDREKYRGLVDLRMCFADIDKCPLRTVATFNWSAVGIAAISGAVAAIIDSY